MESKQCLHWIEERGGGEGVKPGVAYKINLIVAWMFILDERLNLDHAMDALMIELTLLMVSLD